MSRYKKIRVLRNKEIRKLSKNLLSYFNLDIIKKKDVVEEIEISGKRILAINKKPYFIMYRYREKNDPIYIPTLLLIHDLGEKNPFKTVVVDDGAVKFIASGANIMRPGIIKFEDGIEKEQQIIVKDKKGRMLSVGISLFSSDEFHKMKNGMVIKNVHHIGDKIWAYFTNVYNV